MQKTTEYYLLTFYKFVKIDNPKKEVKKLKQYLNDIGMKGRIYIGGEGINVQCSANIGQTEAMKLYLEGHKYFSNIPDIDIKATPIDGHKFPKMAVKYREEIVALGKLYPVEKLKEATNKVSIEEFKNVLDNESVEDYAVIDMRNNYEFKLGHFKNAIPAGTKNFSETEQYIEDYKREYGDKKLFMYCTGGIRCEKIGAMLEDAGLENVFQLDGGVIKYINTFDDGNWLGNLYTFDERVSTEVGTHKTHSIISKCHYTDEPTEHYYNCRYGPCNSQIIAKPKQYKKHFGFCSAECYHKGREDLYIRDVAFDTVSYKDIRIEIKLDNSIIAEKVSFVQEHLDMELRGVKFRYDVPIVDSTAKVLRDIGR